MRVATRPLTLVPATEVQDLLDEINERFRCRLFIPTKRNVGFALNFGFGGTPMPTYLGVCSSREERDRLEGRIKLPQGDYNEFDKTSPTFLEFEEMLDTGVQSSKNRKKSSGAGKLKREHIRMVSERQSASEMRRTQCYFGLRLSRNLDGPDDLEDSRVMAPLDMTAPVPCGFFNDPVFISIDVECNERAHSQITEVGVSTLDSLDLVKVPPGEKCENWSRLIQSRHFRTREYQHVVNREFLAGCPDKFEFGKSEWVSVRDLRDTMDSCFRPPYSFGDRIGDEEDVVVSMPIRKLRNRRVVLVGHNPAADVAYLQSIGVSIAQDRSADGGPSSYFLDVLDTATLFRTYRGEAATRTLGNVLNAFNLVGWNLHNAGNDAHYTMEAVIHIALNSRRHAEPGTGNVPMTNDSPVVAQVPVASPVQGQSPSAGGNEHDGVEQVREENNVDMQEASEQMDAFPEQNVHASGNGIVLENGHADGNGHHHHHHPHHHQPPVIQDGHQENGHMQEPNGTTAAAHEREGPMYEYDADGYAYDENGYAYDENGYAYDENGYAYDEYGQVVEGLRYHGNRYKREQRDYVERDFEEDIGYVDQEIGYSEKELGYVEDEIDYEQDVRAGPHSGTFVGNVDEID